jgi:2-polyprenyl-3-methyl-5-hydroxy-6-metoxy-1,4-benzoquinol methylase
MDFFFPDNHNFDKKKFFNLIKNCNKILDFGCGKGTIDLKKNSKKKLYLYDKNPNLFKYLKLKYKKNKNYIVLKKPKFKNIDAVLLNSVIQYIDENQFTKLISKIVNNKTKIVIFSDISKFCRVIEAIILILVNPKKLIKGLQYIFIKEYRKMGFYYRNLNDLTNMFKKNYKIKILKNLNDDKITRYTILLKIK